ncbi:WD domain-containing protein [Histoplasma ohiense]|nr:WD domain-containing protein [Histoplasma ohiense (nom. inval.)]
MATATATSSLSIRLGNVWQALALRSDVEDIIKELLGHFSLEKIYSDGNKESYQALVTTLLSQLNAIFYIQRLSLPAEKTHTGSYLGFLVSWETSLRCVEFVIQIVEDGRESLWEIRRLRDYYLAEFLLLSLRFLSLHPKAPTGQRTKDRRERFSRIHRSLERVYDSYPGPKSFLLQVCKEVTGSLRSDPDSLALPSRLRNKLPNLGTEMYPLAHCLLSESVSTIVPKDGSSDDWLCQFMALRDVTLFVVGTNVQYAVNTGTRNPHLQAMSSETRNAVLAALDHVKLPHHLSKADLIASFSDGFRVVLPNTPNVTTQNSSESDDVDENVADALDAFCQRLGCRQLISRVSDREVIHSITEITRNIALLDDPSAQFRASRPRLYVLNCRGCHFAGYSQLRYLDNINLPLDSSEVPEVSLPPGTNCRQCGDVVTMAREIQLARHTWNLLSHIESNADTINVERHLPTQFQLPPPKGEAGGSFPSYSNVTTPVSPRTQETDSSLFTRTIFSTSDPSSATPQSPSSQFTHLIRHRFDTPRTEFSPMDSLTAINETEDNVLEPGTIVESRASHGSHDCSAQAANLPGIEKTTTTATSESTLLVRSRTLQSPASADKGKMGWRKLTGTKKESLSASGDTSSLSSSFLESQKLDEIPLKSLVNSMKSAKGRFAKNINVYLSQNSTFALFWTHTTIHVWDVGTSPPTMKRAFSIDSTCLLAAVTKMYLAYVIGTRDHKLTLRIINLIDESVPVVEYRMSSTLWCKCITVCPMENYVVIGFENSIVRFFKTTDSEPPREDRLHSLFHRVCTNCTLDTLSFSRDGLVLLASTRNPKGVIQVFQWKFPFVVFHELPACRYYVPLHESEDNGVSATLFRSSRRGDELVCITTWTQSGVPILAHPKEGNKTDVKTENAGRHGRLGNRIQCASFSPSGAELAMVNDRGYLYQISNLDSSPMDVKRLATSKELTTKSDSFAMSYMATTDEDTIIMAWVDAATGVANVKRVPVAAQGDITMSAPPMPQQPPSPKYELPESSRDPPRVHELPRETEPAPVKRNSKPAVELPTDPPRFLSRFRGITR